MLTLGFASGLPLPLIFSTLSLWLHEAGVARSTITFFSWAALSYSFKFLWAPVIDHLSLPWLTARLGRRRAWLLLSQLAVAGALVFMAFSNPGDTVLVTAIAAVLLGFTAATQDIVVDAWRIEASPVKLQALMSSTYIIGYRMGMLTGGGGALALVSWFSTRETGYEWIAWSKTYLCMAAAILPGLITTLCVREPHTCNGQPPLPAKHMRFVLFFVAVILAFVLTFAASGTAADAATSWLASLGPGLPVASFLTGLLRLGLAVAGALLTARLLTASTLVPAACLHATYVLPFLDFFQRFRRSALLILLLIATYRIADIIMGAVANVFYSDMGYSREQIAVTVKTFGLAMTLCGGLLGGLLTFRYGVMKSLWWGAVLSAASNILFAILAESAPHTMALAGVIAADNLSGGIASTAFVAYLSGLTSRSLTATQYALFSSLMTVFPKLLAGYSGSLVNVMGYPAFFVFSALLGLPVIFLIMRVNRATADHQLPAA